MLAKDLKPGQSFKRNGHGDYREIRTIKDLDKVEKPSTLMRGKIEITCTTGRQFWIYKTDRVSLKP